LLGCCNMKMGDLLLTKCGASLPWITQWGEETKHLAFFVVGFDKDAPESMDELKDRWRKGDMSFIDKITY
jgi:hypothetical protein